jgi:hypothetical protein
MRSITLTALVLAIAAPCCRAADVLVAEITNEFIYLDPTFGGIDEVRILCSIWEDPTGPQSNIFNEVFVLETVDESDAGTVFTADLTDPALAAQLARLTNGEADNIWFGADSDGGFRYESVPETTLFEGQPGPAGLTLRGPDLENYTPTRVELELTDLIIEDDGIFLTTVTGATVLRIYAEAERSVTVEIGGANYWGLAGDPDNESRVFDLAARLGLPPNTPMMVRAVAAEFLLTSVAPSPGYHAQTTFDFNNNGSWTLAFFPASFPFFSPVTEEPVEFGPSFYDDGPLPFSPLGIVRVGFEDHLADDIPDAPDAFLDPSATASFIVRPACNRADRQVPLGILDLADVSQFVGAFRFQLQAADIAPPYGIFDLNDVTVFIEDFTAGCP